MTGRRPRSLPALYPFLAAGLLPLASPAADDDLDRHFRHPPDAVRPHVEWHWMHGNITKEGIKLDLEAMHRVGIRGALIWNAAPFIPPGPAQFMTPGWRELMRYAIAEAAALGMETGFHNADGWSSSGGPWVAVEQSMKELTWSETSVSGGKTVDVLLEQPFTRNNYYRDVAVLAVPAPTEASERMRDLSPKVTILPPEESDRKGGEADKPLFHSRVTTALQEQDGSRITDGDPLTVVTGPAPSPEAPHRILIEMERPLRARTLVITPGPSFGAHGGFLEASEDGRIFTKVCDFQIPEMDNAQSYLAQGFDPVVARHFRLTFNRSDRRRTALTLAEVELSPEYTLEDWRMKAGFTVSHKSSPKLDRRPLPEGQAIPPGQVIDLTRQLGADGRLHWEAPPGRWRLLRFGYTTTGKENKPASRTGRGYECDKMNKAAVDAFWNGMVKTVLDDNREQAGKSLRYLTLDSLEVGTQNYTAEMPELFRERTGYSMIPYLPALTGSVVDSIDITERFLWDYRRVVADLWKECYFEHLNALAERNGLLFNAQVYGNGNFDVVSAASAVSAPASEFWVGKHPSAWARHRLMTSAAHLQGRSLVFAESFTAHPKDGGWRNSPASLKRVGDRAFCDGVTALMFHTYAHQPWIDARPGMTMGPFGMHFNRGNTWWEYIGPWMDYVARCQLLLQKGMPPVDLAVFIGENSPVHAPIRLPLEGYHYEYIDRFFLEKLKVEAGRLVLPGGMSYAALYIPPEERGYSLPVLRAIRRLAEEGATVFADRPHRTPGLQNFPQSESELKNIAQEIWGDRPSPQGRSFGKGKILPASAKLADVLRQDLALPPDCVTEGPADDFAFAHRIDGGAHYYFLSNQGEKPFSQDVRFRATGLKPELWDPLTGKIQAASEFSADADGTRIPIELPPGGSLFVVFQNRENPLQALTQTKWGEGEGTPPAMAIEGPWTLTFSEKGAPERSLIYKKLKSWTEESSDDSVRYFAGTAVYETEFELPEEYAADPSLRLRLDLGRVEVIANVELNGRSLGNIWAAPFRSEITEVVKAGTNRLKIRVANLWPNRLIGDQKLGDPFNWADNGAPHPDQWPRPLVASEWPEKAKGRHWATWRHFRATDPLLPSGLLGPVKIEYGCVKSSGMP